MNMQFINARGLSNNNRYSSIVVMPRTIAQSRNVIVEASSSELVQNTSQSKQMIWGEPTWFLFHTLAEKVRDDRFDQIKNGLFSHIVAICGILPCPICAQHASEYMRRLQINAIRNKKDLKEMLPHLWMNF
jgi:hypothetical protein